MGLSKLNNPWVQISWGLTAGLLVIAALLGFVLLSREQQNGPPLELWSALCRGLGITGDIGPAGELRPPLATPTRIAWTSADRTQVASGNIKRGEFVAINCTACHGEQGVSASDQFPTLAGMDAAAIYKQLDDFRTGKRSSGVMHAIAHAISEQASADVAAYYASLTNGLAPIVNERLRAGHTLREHDPAKRLAFAGDPARGIAPCSACHGPGGHKLGAPSVQGQRPAYIERQLAGFAQGVRRNDINQQMRTIATQLTPEEMQLIAKFYGTGMDARQ